MKFNIRWNFCLLLTFSQSSYNIQQAKSEFLVFIDVKSTNYRIIAQSLIFNRRVIVLISI